MMQRILPKYHPFFYVLSIVFFFLTFSFSTHAQSETDTTIFKIETDSATTHSNEYDGGGSKQSKEARIDYFLKKEETGSGINNSVELRQVPGSITKKMKEDDAFWYANANIQTQKEKNIKARTSIYDQQWFQVLLWLIIIGGFAGCLMYYLANSEAGLFRKKNKIISSSSEEEVETDNIFQINYQKEINKAIEKGNYRFAIRLLFLKTLRELADKKIIQYKQDRTNFDYLLQLHSSSYYNDFFKITRNYEYSWYGQFEIKRETFDIINSDFKNFEQRITAA